MEKVSILIPCYNAEQWIEQAVQSALDQTYPNIEVIVVDDGSSDGSFAKLQQFGDAIVCETGPNRGGNPTRNRLLELSQGTWLQYLDADDFLKPDKVAKQMALVEEDGAVDVLFGPGIMAYQEGTGFREEVFPIPEPHDDAFVLIAQWDLPQTGCPLWRRDAVVDVNGWKDGLPCCQEHDLYSRLLIAGKRFRYTSEAGAVYRQWSEETVCKKNKTKVHHYQTEIRKAIEQYLAKIDALSPERRRALCQGHFNTARQVWLYDRKKAEAIMQYVAQLMPGFLPAGDAAPSSFQLIYRLLGYAQAERFAALKRQILG